MSSLFSSLLSSEFFMNTPEILLIFTVKEQPTSLILHSKSLVFLSVLSNKCMSLCKLGEVSTTELHLYTPKLHLVACLGKHFHHSHY